MSESSLLQKMFISATSGVEARLFAEYGSVFATLATPPSQIIFMDSPQVDVFQSSLTVSRAVFGEYKIELQAEAMSALIKARDEIAEFGGSLSARAADAGSRSYEDTARLWTRNVEKGIEHWIKLGRLTPAEATTIRELSPTQQVAEILKLEDEAKIFFGTFFDKSILYSVAAPGASQHLSKLAFDVAEYESEEVKTVLGQHGWYRTVPNDLPHFTYLGLSEEEMQECGLKRIERIYSAQVYDFWIPDLTSLKQSALDEG
jgi:hypothetical protein